MSGNHVDEDDNGPMDAKDLLEEIIISVVDDPSAVKITEVQDKDCPNVRVLHVDVAQPDRGKVIGQGGVIAQSLRCLFSLIGQQAKQQIEVRVNGGNGWKPRPQRENFQFGKHQQQAPQMMMVPVPANFLRQAAYPNQGYPNQGYPNQGYPNQGRRARRFGNGG